MRYFAACLRYVRQPVTPSRSRLYSTTVNRAAVVLHDRASDHERLPTQPAESSTSHFAPICPPEEFNLRVAELKVLVQLRDRRLELHRHGRNPTPDPYLLHQRQSSEPRPGKKKTTTRKVVQSFQDFRHLVRKTKCDKALGKVYIRQLERCFTPKDILRTVAVALYDCRTAERFWRIEDALKRALYRCRDYVSDAEIAQCFRVIIARGLHDDRQPNDMLIQHGLRFAARARSRDGMQKLLKIMRKNGDSMAMRFFRAITAKFSFGHQGLGEIRNGRWRRSHLMQVLLGFENEKHLPVEQQSHLELFLDRTDPVSWRGWLMILGRCRATDVLWREWQIWHHNEDRYRKNSRWKPHMFDDRVAQRWIIEQLAIAGDEKRVWDVINESRIPLHDLGEFARARLLKSFQYAETWTPELKEDLLDNLSKELEQMEKALGVQWQPASRSSKGEHFLRRKFDDVLEELSKEDWVLDAGHGFPYQDEEEAKRLLKKRSEAEFDSA